MVVMLSFDRRQLPAAAILARLVRLPAAIVVCCLCYFGSDDRQLSACRATLHGLWPWLVAIGICQGVFALFTMYMPPLFPTLLRTTGAGFCYNIGRIAAAAGTVFFGLLRQGRRLSPGAALRRLPVPAGGRVSLLLPEPPDEQIETTILPGPET